MINEKLLLENGYKEYEDIFKARGKFYQKRFKNDKGQTKYFVNFYPCISYEGYEVDLQFEKDKYVMNILLFGIHDMTLEEIEEEVHKIWYELDCKYYDCEVES